MTPGNDIFALGIIQIKMFKNKLRFCIINYIFEYIHI